MAKIRFDHVTVRYGNHTVVKDFSLDVQEGEILGIVGPSGCGKTSLVRSLGGFINPDEGDIYINDNLVYSKKKRVNRPGSNASSLFDSSRLDFFDRIRKFTILAMQCQGFCLFAGIAHGEQCGNGNMLG